MRSTPGLLVARRSRGFTLLELMTAIAVLAILLGIGVPSFTNIMRNNQIAAESNNLLVALTLARSEALKRGLRVSLCPANGDQTACTGTNNWSNGWLVFTDDNGGMGALDAGDEILQAWTGPANNVQVNTAVTSLTFTRTGRPESIAAQTFRVVKAGCSGDQQRLIQVDGSGRVSLVRENCPE